MPVFSCSLRVPISHNGRDIARAKRECAGLCCAYTSINWSRSDSLSALSFCSDSSSASKATFSAKNSYDKRQKGGHEKGAVESTLDTAIPPVEDPFCSGGVAASGDACGGTVAFPLLVAAGALPTYTVKAKSRYSLICTWMTVSDALDSLVVALVVQKERAVL